MLQTIQPEIEYSVLFAAELAKRNAVRNPEDYERDGLLYCGKCHTPKQTHTPYGIVDCACKCKSDSYERAKSEQEQKDRLASIRRLPVNGLHDPAIKDFTFNGAEGSAQIKKCHKYCNELWPEMLEMGQGLILYGGPGTGKSFAAACIVNDLRHRKIPALFTTVPKYINAMSGLKGQERLDYVSSLRNFPLLVLDDLDSQRKTSYGSELLFDLIDSRIKTNLPLVVTTNLDTLGMKNETDISQKRIYDRILQVCWPLGFEGGSRRAEDARERLELAKKLFLD